MKEGKIISFVAIFGCLIMANTSEGSARWFWMGLAAIYYIRFAYLNYKSLH